MKVVPTAFVCCTVIAAAAGFAGTAAAQPKASSATGHVMTVQLPDGSLESIRYSGDAPPNIDFQGDPAAALFAMPIFDATASSSPFAALDRLSAMMDRQAAAMMQEANSVDAAAFADPRGPLSVDFAKLPPGVQGYSVVSTLSSNGVCSRSIRYLGSSDGKAPRVETTSSGDCSAMATGSRPAVMPKTQMPHRPALIEASAPVHAKRPAVTPELVAYAAD